MALGVADRAASDPAAVARALRGRGSGLPGLPGTARVPGVAGEPGNAVVTSLIGADLCTQGPSPGRRRPAVTGADVEGWAGREQLPDARGVGRTHLTPYPARPWSGPTLSLPPTSHSASDVNVYQ